VAYIGWEIAGVASNHAMIFRERFATFEEASNFAHNEALAWLMATR
jgi:hypothetical protein